MKKRRLCIWGLFSLVTIVGNAYSAPDVWSDWTRITHLYPGRHTMFFLTEYKNKQYSTCDDGARFALDHNNPDYKIQAATLLTAYALGKEINMVIVGGAANCYATLDRFMVR